MKIIVLICLLLLTSVSFATTDPYDVNALIANWRAVYLNIPLNFLGLTRTTVTNGNKTPMPYMTREITTDGTRWVDNSDVGADVGFVCYDGNELMTYYVSENEAYITRPIGRAKYCWPDILTAMGCERVEKDSVPFLEGDFDLHTSGKKCYTVSSVETIAGKVCAKMDFGVVKVWLAVDCNSLPMRLEIWQRRDPNKPAIVEDGWVVQEVGSVETPNGRVYYPRRYTRHVEWDKNGSYDCFYVITGFKLGMPITDSMFKLDLPKGTRVVDSIRGYTYYAGMENIEQTSGVGPAFKK